MNIELTPWCEGISDDSTKEFDDNWLGKTEINESDEDTDHYSTDLTKRIWKQTK